jgi:hypothetical protein
LARHRTRSQVTGYGASRLGVVLVEVIQGVERHGDVVEFVVEQVRHRY